MLRREEAIKKHRAMWNWIAEQIVNDEHTMDIANLKLMYLHMKGDDKREMYMHNNCYLCEYTNVNCRRCPLSWPSDVYDYMCEYGYFGEGLYLRCLDLSGSDEWKLQAELAYEIANLPERKM